MRTEPPQGLYETPPRGVDLTLADWSFPDAFKDEVIERWRRLDWRSYPSADAMVARQAIADRFGVSVDTVLATNGCMEALDLVARWAGQTHSMVSVPSPGYFAYGRIMNNSGVEVEPYDPAGVERVCLRENNHLLVCNPNNPTGDWYEREALKRLRLPDGSRLIVDSTYAFFREDYRTELFSKYLHCGFINLLSFSKAFGLAGLRLGAMIAPVPVLERLAAIRPRYVLDLAQSVSIEVLLTERWYRHAQKEWNSLRREALTLKSFLETIPGLTVFPQTANFVSFLNRTPEGKEIVPRALLEELPCKIWNCGLVRLTLRRELSDRIRSRLAQWCNGPAARKEQRGIIWR